MVTDFSADGLIQNPMLWLALGIGSPTRRAKHVLGASLRWSLPDCCPSFHSLGKISSRTEIAYCEGLQSLRAFLCRNIPQIWALAEEQKADCRVTDYQLPETWYLTLCVCPFLSWWRVQYTSSF